MLRFPPHEWIQGLLALFGEEIIKAIKQGKIKFDKYEDDDYSFAQLAGDCFNPYCNEDIPPATLKKRAAAFKRRISTAGVWFIQSSYWTGRSWEGTKDIIDNSIGGFVGNDFFVSSNSINIDTPISQVI